MTRSTPAIGGAARPWGRLFSSFLSLSPLSQISFSLLVVLSLSLSLSLAASLSLSLALSQIPFTPLSDLYLSLSLYHSLPFCLLISEFSLSLSLSLSLGFLFGSGWVASTKLFRLLLAGFWPLLIQIWLWVATICSWWRGSHQAWPFGHGPPTGGADFAMLRSPWLSPGHGWLGYDHGGSVLATVWPCSLSSFGSTARVAVGLTTMARVVVAGAVVVVLCVRSNYCGVGLGKFLGFTWVRSLFRGRCRLRGRRMRGQPSGISSLWATWEPLGCCEGSTLWFTIGFADLCLLHGCFLYYRCITDSDIAGLVGMGRL